MEEDMRDRRDSRRTETERLQRQREGEAVRSRTARRHAIPADACRSMPARLAKEVRTGTN
jgi:hypothetical protein